MRLHALQLLLLLLQLFAVALSTGGADSPVVELDEKNFDELVHARDAASDVEWLIDFFAPWCPHCQALAPVWEEVAAEMPPPVRMAKVDCVANDALCTRFKIRSYPSVRLVVERTGRVLEYSGKRDRQGLLTFPSDQKRRSKAERDSVDFPPRAPPNATGTSLSALRGSVHAILSSTKLAWFFILIVLAAGVVFVVYDAFGDDDDLHPVDKIV